jgi:hypothetical protein
MFILMPYETNYHLYEVPGLLIGPVLMKRSPGGYWVPDYSRPGVGARIKVEVDMIEDMEWRKRS